MMDNYLMHYGILGMKWGVRRYQNADGTLTNAGKERYAGVSGKALYDLARSERRHNERVRLLMSSVVLSDDVKIAYSKMREAINARNKAGNEIAKEIKANKESIISEAIKRTSPSDSAQQNLFNTWEYIDSAVNDYASRSGYTELERKASDQITAYDKKVLEYAKAVCGDYYYKSVKDADFNKQSQYLGHLYNDAIYNYVRNEKSSDYASLNNDFFFIGDEIQAEAASRLDELYIDK